MSFFFVLVAVVVLAILSRAVVVLDQYERGVRFRLGRFFDVLEPGLSLVYPGVDVVQAIDMRIKTLDVPRQKVITEDNAIVNIDAFIYYRPVKPEKLVLNVAEFEVATVKLAQTTVRSIVGEMVFDHLNTKREHLNDRLKRELLDTVEKWGVELIAVEIREVMPADRGLTDAMVRQVAAERIKRAMILESEGMKASAILLADGDKESFKLEADGYRQAVNKLADGSAQALVLVSKQAQKSIIGPALTLKELEMLEKLASGKNAKIVLPLHVRGMTNSLNGMAGPKERK